MVRIVLFDQDWLLHSEVVTSFRCLHNNRVHLPLACVELELILLLIKLLLTPLQHLWMVTIVSKQLLHEEHFRLLLRRCPNVCVKTDRVCHVTLPRLVHRFDVLLTLRELGHLPSGRPEWIFWLVIEILYNTEAVMCNWTAPLWICCLLVEQSSWYVSLFFKSIEHGHPGLIRLTILHCYR